MLELELEPIQHQIDSVFYSGSSAVSVTNFVCVQLSNPEIKLFISK